LWLTILTYDTSQGPVLIYFVSALKLFDSDTGLEDGFLNVWLS